MKRPGLSFITQQLETAFFGFIILSVMSGQQYPSLSQELLRQAIWLCPTCVFLKLFALNLTLCTVEEAGILTWNPDTQAFLKWRCLPSQELGIFSEQRGWIQLLVFTLCLLPESPLSMHWVNSHWHKGV